MNRSTIAIAFTMTVIAALALGTAPAANAQLSCSDATLKGTFAYTSTGFITAPPSLAGPVAEMGTQTFDAAGNTTATATLSQNGNVGPVSITGTYTVNADCTGTMTLQVSIPGIPAFPLHVSFVMDDNGKEFQAMETDAGFVITRIARKIFPGTTE